jgi:hypothetical protein
VVPPGCDRLGLHLEDLYVKPALWKELEPQMNGWFSHKRPFGFEVGPVDYAEDIHRFMGHLSAANIKSRQYRHHGYREANLNQLIPDLSDRDISDKMITHGLLQSRA